MPLQQNTGGSPITITTTATIKSLPCALIGIFCNSTTSGTITLYAGTSASAQLIAGPITVSAGTFYPLPAVSQDGLHAVVTNTLNVTAFVS